MGREECMAIVLDHVALLTPSLSRITGVMWRSAMRTASIAV